MTYQTREAEELRQTARTNLTGTVEAITCERYVEAHAADTACRAAIDRLAALAAQAVPAATMPAGEPTDSMVDAAMKEYELALTSDPRGTELLMRNPRIVANMRRDAMSEAIRAAMKGATS